MKCPKCGKEWPDDVKFCGVCGQKLQAAGGASVVTEGAVVEKLQSLLPLIGVGKFMEPSPGLFLAQKGSTHVQVRVVAVGHGQTVVRSMSPVTVGTPITQNLLDFLLKENGTLLLGAFGLGPKNEIIYSHAIMSSSMDALEFGASVSAVVNMADKYDDQIVQRWGGKTARQMAAESFLAPALLKAILERRADGAPRAAAVQPSPPVARPVARSPLNVAEAIKVGSVAEEYAFLSRQRCVCGGNYKKEVQALLENNGLSYDRLDVSCLQCGKRRSFLFDINSFHGKR